MREGGDILVLKISNCRDACKKRNIEQGEAILKDLNTNEECPLDIVVAPPVGQAEVPYVGVHAASPTTWESTPTDTRATEHFDSTMLENRGKHIDLSELSFELDKEFTTNYVRRERYT